MVPWKRIIRGGLGICALLLIWQGWTLWLDADSAAPTPARVVLAARDLVTSGELPTALLVSLRRVVLGVAVALIAIPWGLWMGYFKAVEKNLDPVVQTFRSVAPIALVPLAVVWFGTGDISAIFIVSYGAVFPLLVNVIAGVKEVDPVFVRAGLTMGLSKLQVLTRIVLPAVLPRIFVGMRLSMGIAWGAIIAAELAVGAKSGASGGLGQMMFLFYAYSTEMDRIVVCMITVGVIAYAIDHAFRFLTAKFMPWDNQHGSSLLM